MQLHNWSETKLWSELQHAGDAEGRAVLVLLASAMPDIQAVLAQGGTAETDFTLHDSGHAYRVAQRMVDIIPGRALSALSHYEKALLLLSAYLHDIGMTPLRSRISAIHKYLLTGDSQGLPANELNSLREWLDDFRGGVVPPLASTWATATVAAFETAEELVTYYARHRHNDWSEEWIRKHFAEQKMGTYAGWLEDLVLLCRSHHYGYDELRTDAFKPRIAGASGSVVNLRYLAAVLRVADVLEFDPERTPGVIFKHRDVRLGSAIYWHKDHEISMRIDHGRVVVSARPRTARIHKAVEDTIEQIDHELALCRRLAEEFPFDRCPLLSESTGHEWVLASNTHASIEPLSHAYEYIDGAFRPNTARVLNLLSGVELYGNAFAAVRELLQNAFDAVREQIAYARLRRVNPADELHTKELSRSHVVSLRVEADDKGYWLICADSGIGMNKRIIRDYLLVSGQSHRHDILELERRCQEWGFSIGRTGQFGIGVLSYFMIASRVEISTRRSHESGSSESHGWHFSSDGIGSFGELRIDKRVEAGTTVRLLLRPNVLGQDSQAWGSDLERYLSQNIRRLPCRFEVAGNAVGLTPRVMEPGWISTIEDVFERLTRELRRELAQLAESDIPVELLSADSRARKSEAASHWNELRGSLRDSIRCDVTEGALPDRTGSWRSTVAYFELPSGRSLRFLRSTVHGELARIIGGGGYSVTMPGSLANCWKGIAAAIRPVAQSTVVPGRVRRLPILPGPPPNVMLEVDWTSGGAVSVNRQELMLSDQGMRALNQAIAAGRKHRSEFARSTTESRYHLLNTRLVDEPAPSMNRFWIARTQRKATWEELRFPAIDALSYAYSDYNDYQNLRWKGQAVYIHPGLSEPGLGEVYHGITWHGNQIPPTRVLVADDYRRRLVPLWERMEPAAIGRLVTEFPTSWKQLIGADFRNYAQMRTGQILWNSKHPVFAGVTDETWRWCQSTFTATTDPLQYSDTILGSRAYACAWLAHSAVSGRQDVWQGLIERQASFLRNVFRLALGKKDDCLTLLFWVEETTNTRLRMLSSKGWRSEEEYRAMVKLVGPPGRDWTLVRDDADAAPRRRALRGNRPQRSVSRSRRQAAKRR